MAECSENVDDFKPPVFSTTLPLPFDQLSPTMFERLCLWLVTREGYERAEHVGESGSDQGRDVVAYKPTDSGEQLWYFQCKRYQTIGAAALKAEVDKIHGHVSAGDITRPFGICFVTNATISANARDDVRAYCGDRDYACEFWAHGELDERVWRHEDVVKHFFHVVPRSPTGLHQLPEPPRDFVGRAALLDELQDAVKAGGVTISCVRGLGGVGKTAVALVLAARLSSEYPNAQFFVDLRGTSDAPQPPTAAMAHVIRAYHPEAKLPDDENQLAGLYRSVLHGKRAILLMDNARDAEQVRPLIPPAGCVMLVTSRQHFVLPDYWPVNLEELPPNEARGLLLKIAGRLTERTDETDEIARLCGYLPLALRAAASLLEVTGDLDPGDYARQLADERTRLERIGQEGVDFSVEASLGLSYRHLADEEARVLHAASVFPASFDATAAEAVCEDHGHTHVSRLVRVSVVNYDTASNRYRLHDLVRLFASARAGEQELSSAQRRHAEHFCQILGQAEDLYFQGNEDMMTALANFDGERANIEAGQTWATAHTHDDTHAADLCSKYPNVGGYCLNLRLHPRERVRWLEAALAAARSLKDRQAEGNQLRHLGNACLDLGNVLRAIEYYEQALVIAREIGDRGGEGRALDNLGNAHRYLGQMPCAMEYCEQAFAIARDIHDRREKGIALMDLGNVYADLGEVRQAIEYYEQALAISREIGNRRGESAALGNLGLAYAELGEVRRAIEYYERTLAIAREMGDRRGEGTHLGNLGMACGALGEVRRAIECHEQALAIAREIGDRRGEGNHLGSLGDDRLKLGDARRAIEYHEQALGIAREIGDRRGEGIHLGNLGNDCLKLGEARRAIEYYEQSLTIAGEIGDQGTEGTELGNLGNAYAELGEVGRAIEYYEQGLAIDREIGDRRGEGTDLGNLGNAYSRLGEVRRAIEYYELALAIAREIGDRRGEGAGLWNMAIALQKLGQREDAIRCCEESLTLLEQVEHPYATKVRETLAEWRGEGEGEA